MACSVCGSRAVVLRGSYERPTHTECTYCGARDCAKPDQTVSLGPTPDPARLPVSLSGGCMLSAVERGDYGRMFGLDALEELLGRGPEG